MPSILDLNLRLAYQLPAGHRSVRPRVQLDLLHVFSRRSGVEYDDARELVLDENGQPVANPNFGRALRFQPPMSTRVGMLVDF